MGRNDFNTVYYADDVILISENESNLQRLLFWFNNKINSQTKTKTK